MIGPFPKISIERKTTSGSLVSLASRHNPAKANPAAAEHYQEAIELVIRAAEANPEFPDVYAVRAAAEGQLGRVDAARSTLDELLRRMPGLTVANFERLNRPFVRAADRERFLDGLRKAGLPEA